LAFLHLLETLSPPERAVFLLHEVLDYPFSEIGMMLSKSTANCRQIYHRARQALQEQRTRFEPEPQRLRQLLFSFISATQAGNMEALTSLLAQDVVSWADGGGKARANLKPLSGKLAVARFWLSVTRKNQRPLTETLAEINGSPAILLWDEGRLAGVISLTLSAVGIQEIYALLNPEKLAYLQKQLSGRGTAPETSKLSSFSPDQR
jgi:RNA polymerase sigma-70 factor (ECF subfamily)